MTAQEVVARTIWGEARSVGEAGMEGVACVIRNRVERPGWWGTSWEGVCLKPWQFSCWNKGDPNREKLMAVNETDPLFYEAMVIAEKVIDGKQPDITGGADSYYSTYIPAPHWTYGARFTVQIGNLKFYVTQ